MDASGLTRRITRSLDLVDLVDLVDLLNPIGFAEHETTSTTTRADTVRGYGGSVFILFIGI